MTKITLLDFRLDAERILRRVQKGQRMILTRRGKPVARLEPIEAGDPDEDDPFYSMCDLAEAGRSLSNAQMDELIYGE
jgi:prevent-host-death family protein